MLKEIRDRLFCWTVWYLFVLKWGMDGGGTAQYMAYAHYLTSLSCQ